MTHLWEAKHAYYCAPVNYYAPGAQLVSEYKSFGEFVEEFGDADMDFNLVFRWDWTEEDDRPYPDDANYRNGVLNVFFMGQRKGLYFWSEVQVCRADESAVRAWLQPRLDHLRSLWEPLS